MLFQLTFTVCSSKSLVIRSKFAFLAASLHIICPAGIFLSAPYAESLFSLLNFLGLYLYAKAYNGNPMQSGGIFDSTMIILSGVLFGLATTLRGNGLLSGLILLYDLIKCITRMWYSPSRIGPEIWGGVTLGASGTLMASIAFIPQYLAYSEFCRGPDSGEYIRPWCLKWFPSIYAWVQKEYW